MAWTDEDDVMAWTFESALEDAVITIVARDDARGSYAIRVGVLRTPVVIELRESPTIGGQFEFRTSHAIHTPLQIAPYRTNKAHAGDAPYALHRAIDSLTRSYRWAVNAGHQPSESWLVSPGVDWED